MKTNLKKGKFSLKLNTKLVESRRSQPNSPSPIRSDREIDSTMHLNRKKSERDLLKLKIRPAVNVQRVHTHFFNKYEKPITPTNEDDQDESTKNTIKRSPKYYNN